MSKFLDPYRFALTSLAGWMNQCHLQTIDYLREENRVLREQLGDRRLRLTNEQRRRLAAQAKGLGRRVLAERTGIGDIAGFKVRCRISATRLPAAPSPRSCSDMALNPRPNEIARHLGRSFSPDTGS